MSTPTITLSESHKITKHPHEYTHSCFLAERPPMVYTVCRTFHQKNIVNYLFHMKRTANSIFVIMKEADTEQNAKIDSNADAALIQIESLLDALLRKDLPVLIQACIDYFNDKTAEFRLTIVVESTLPLVCSYHAEALPPVVCSPVEIAAWTSHGRGHPNVKSSAWLESPAKKRMEKSICGRVNEALMIDENGNVLEGLSSNAYVIMNGKVYTAPLSYVLKGTMRSLVEKACKELNTLFIEECPNFNDVSKWETLFISSSSRAVIECDCLKVYSPDGNEERQLSLQTGGKVFIQLQQSILKMLESEAVKIL